jgi:hypothetical protein
MIAATTDAGARDHGGWRPLTAGREIKAKIVLARQSPCVFVVCVLVCLWRLATDSRRLGPLSPLWRTGARPPLLLPADGSHRPPPENDSLG